MKKSITLLGVLNCVFSIFSQEMPDIKDNIILPDIMTIVEGDVPVVADDAIPSFVSVIPPEKPLTETVVEEDIIPVSVNETENKMLSPSEMAVRERSLFMEGSVGGGWPGNVMGDIFIQTRRSSDNATALPSPFTFRFNHNSAFGFGTHDPAKGYTVSNTLLKGRKTFTREKIEWYLDGLYNTSSDGLQSKSLVFSDITNHTIDGKTGLLLFLPQGFSLNGNMNIGLFTRYADSIANDTMPSLSHHFSVFSIVPALGIDWKKNSVGIAFDAEYLYNNLYGSASDSIHRGSIMLSAFWEREAVLRIEGKTAVVFTSADVPGQIIIPFSLSAEGKIPLGKTDRQIMVAVSGGLESFQPEYGSLFTDNVFTVFRSLAGEQSDWFARTSVIIPVGSMFAVSVLGEFRSTALENGCAESDFSSWTAEYGFFSGRTVTRTSFDSDIGISFAKGMFDAGITWRSRWLHVPAGAYRNSIIGTFAVHDSDARWGADISAEISWRHDRFALPDISFGSFYRATRFVSFALKMTDVVPLILGRDRIYEGPYILRGGAITFLLQFYL